MPLKSQQRKPTNLTLDSNLITEAKSYGINLSSAAEQGLQSAVAQARAQQWKRENEDAIKSSNEWIMKNGLPLSDRRLF